MAGRAEVLRGDSVTDAGFQRRDGPSSRALLTVRQEGSIGQPVGDRREQKRSSRTIIKIHRPPGKGLGKSRPRCADHSRP